MELSNFSACSAVLQTTVPQGAPEVLCEDFHLMLDLIVDNISLVKNL
jgi:hypothetical protein